MDGSRYSSHANKMQFYGFKKRGTGLYPDAKKETVTFSFTVSALHFSKMRFPLNCPGQEDGCGKRPMILP